MKLCQCLDMCVAEWVEIYSKEALSGITESMLIYSKLLLRGSINIPEDAKQALYWLKKACKNSPEAAFRLGNFYRKGKHVKKDIEKAFFYFNIGMIFKCKCGNLQEQYHENLISTVHPCYPNECAKALQNMPLTISERSRLESDFSVWKSSNVR